MPSTIPPSIVLDVRERIVGASYKLVGLEPEGPYLFSFSSGVEELSANSCSHYGPLISLKLRQSAHGGALEHLKSAPLEEQTFLTPTPKGSLVLSPKVIKEITQRNRTSQEG